MVGLMAPPSSPAARVSVARRLNDEWRRLATSPAFRVHLRQWPVMLARYDDGNQLLAATGRDGGLPTAEADQLLAVLIALAHHDELAARVVLQRVIPGLIN